MVTVLYEWAKEQLIGIFGQKEYPLKKINHNYGALVWFLWASTFFHRWKVINGITDEVQLEVKNAAP